MTAAQSDDAWREGLTDEQQAIVEEASETIRNLYLSSVNTFGVAPARIINQIAMTGLTNTVQIFRLENRIAALEPPA